MRHRTAKNNKNSRPVAYCFAARKRRRDNRQKSDEKEEDRVYTARKQEVERTMLVKSSGLLFLVQVKKASEETQFYNVNLQNI
jgi:hypothetical protein